MVEVTFGIRLKFLGQVLGCYNSRDLSLIMKSIRM